MFGVWEMSFCINMAEIKQVLMIVDKKFGATHFCPNCTVVSFLVTDR